ncbi:MAG: citrate synthase [Actinomycetota bacterium]
MDPINTSPSGPRGLSAAEAAELLGVKRQTIYAYVSRGILHRRMALDGRTSVFDRAEVEALRQGRNPERDGELRTVLTTRLTRVADDGIWIRGRDLVATVADGAGFVEVADLVWDGQPDERWPRFDPIPDPATAAGGGPAAGDAQLPPLDQFRAIVARTSGTDPLRHDLSPRGARAAGRRAIVAMLAGLRTPGVSPVQPPVEPSSDERRPTAGDALWPRLTAAPATPARARAVEITLALLVDHGLAASTFAARVAASVRSDPYAVIGAGLGALGGPLHGAASVAVHDMYASAEAAGDAAAAVGDVIRRLGRAPGFGHTVYRTQDPRYGALMAQIVEAWATDERLQTVFRVRDVIGERSDAIPNVDLAIGALSFLARMPSHAGEAMFAVARTAGWVAHAMEEYEEKPLRFRPKAQYLGPAPAD